MKKKNNVEQNFIPRIAEISRQAREYIEQLMPKKGIYLLNPDIQDDLIEESDIIDMPRVACYKKHYFQHLLYIYKLEWQYEKIFVKGRDVIDGDPYSYLLANLDALELCTLADRIILHLKLYPEQFKK